MPLQSLLACAGTWKGTNTLHDPHTSRPEESLGTLRVTPLLDNRFVRLDYTWSYQDKPQEGSLLVGYDPGTRTISGHWIDSWHMGHTAMILLGAEPEGAALRLAGTYAAPPGPDWGWRIEVTAAAGVDALRITMVNIWPDAEKEEMAVEAVYTRLAS